MVATLTSIYCGEESLPTQGICASYRGHPARARWGQNNRSVAQPAEYFCRGARVIETFPGKYWAVRCCATALRPPYHHLCLAQIEVMAMQLVSYGPHTLDFTFILYYSSRARGASCCSNRLAF
jgi:hypothetical protein